MSSTTEGTSEDDHNITEDSVDSEQNDGIVLDRKNDRLMAKQFRKTAIETIGEKRQMFIDYEKEQKGRMISFLTCVFAEPLTPIFNQMLNQYLKPVNFSIFEGIRAEKIKNMLVSDDEVEKLRNSFEATSIFDKKEDNR